MPDEAGERPWRGVASAFCTCLLGLGLARFAYTPLIPALIAAHWFTPSEAVFLGAANLAGYLAGALAIRIVMRRLGLRTTIRALMVLATASLLGCARPSGFAWFCACRLAAGFAGSGLMVLAAPAVLPLVPARHRGLAGGVIFTGIGVGVAASGTILPALLHWGLGAAWLALAAGGAAMTGLAWTGWPKNAPPAPASATAPAFPPGLAFLFAAYATNAVGQIPAMLFLADFVARGMGLGIATGGHVWAALGLGALAGPLAAGWLSDRIGPVAALRLHWAAQIAASVTLWWAPGVAVVAVSGLVIGAGIPGLVVLVLVRTQALAGPEAPRAWGIATTCFAGGQAAGAYALSFVFRSTGSYQALFASAVLAMGLALGLGEASRVLVAARAGREIRGSREGRHPRRSG